MHTFRLRITSCLLSLIYLNMWILFLLEWWDIHFLPPTSYMYTKSICTLAVEHDDTKYFTMKAYSDSIHVLQMRQSESWGGTSKDQCCNWTWDTPFFWGGGCSCKAGQKWSTIHGRNPTDWWMEWNEKMLIQKECNVVAMGTDLDHWCNNRSCLWWGTLQEFSCGNNVKTNKVKTCAIH